MKWSLLIISLLVLNTGCSSNHFAYQTEKVLKTARQNVIDRDLKKPEYEQSDVGSSADIKKGIKHSTNEEITFFVLSIFGIN